MIRRIAGIGAVSLTATVLAVMAASPAYAATYSIVDAEPTDVITTVNGDVTVTSTLGEGAQFNSDYAATGYFATDGSGRPLSFVDWTFSQPVYQLTVYYFAVESAASNGGADTQSFSTNLGPINLDLVADGGNRVSSTGDLNSSGQPEAGYVDSSATCELTELPFACSGTIELSFPEGITSFRSYNGGLPGSGFNGTGIALASDVVDPVAEEPEAEEEADEEELAETGVDYSAAFGAGLLALGLLVAGGVLLRRRA